MSHADDEKITPEGGRHGGSRYKALLIAGCVFLLILSLGSAISYRNTITPRGIIIHHSAVTFTRQGLPLDMEVLASAHRRRGYGAFYWGRVYHIGYHYVIFPDGSVVQGRPERCRGAHAVGHNSDLGICLVGDFSAAINSTGEVIPSKPTDAQMRALVDLTRQLRAHHNLPLESIRRHHDVNGGTKCPGEGFPFQEFLDQLKVLDSTLKCNR